MRRTAVWLTVLLWAVACLPAHAIKLRYRPAKGTVVKHKTTLTGTTTMDMPMGQGTMNMTTNGFITTTEKVLEATDNTVTVETVVTGGTMTLNMGGREQSIAMPQTRMVAETDDRGRVTKVIEADLGTQTGPMAGMDYNDFAEFSAAFPDKDLDINDTWKDQMKLPLGEGQEIILTANSRLLQLTTLQGRKCAKIRSAFQGPMNMDLTAQGGGVMTGQMSAQFVTYYDYENSVYVSSEGTVNLTMTMSMTDPSGESMDVSTKTSMKIKVKLVQ